MSQSVNKVCTKNEDNITEKGENVFHLKATMFPERSNSVANE